MTDTYVIVILTLSMYFLSYFLSRVQVRTIQVLYYGAGVLQGRIDWKSSATHAFNGLACDLMQGGSSA